MLFKEVHKEMILNGTKTATRRVWKKPMVKIGNTYKCKTQMLSKEFFAVIRVKSLYQQGLYFMTDKDAKKEGYKNMEEFVKIWEEINGEWNSNLKVWVVEFEVIKQ